MRETFGYSDRDDTSPDEEEDVGEEEEEEEEEEPEVDEREAWRVHTSFRPDKPTLYVVDYKVRVNNDGTADIVFPERTEAATMALANLSSWTPEVHKIIFEDYERDWVPRLGPVALFPAYFVGNDSGVFRIAGSFLRRIYMIERVNSTS